jgi:hypothetical protein
LNSRCSVRQCWLLSRDSCSPNDRIEVRQVPSSLSDRKSHADVLPDESDWTKVRGQFSRSCASVVDMRNTGQILVDKSDSIGGFDSGLAYFLGLFVAASLLYAYLRNSRRKKFGRDEYFVLMLLLSGCAIWIFFVARS